jgi:hypothetical protein
VTRREGVKTESSTLLATKNDTDLLIFIKKDKNKLLLLLLY